VKAREENTLVRLPGGPAPELSLLLMSCVPLAGFLTSLDSGSVSMEFS
jgi:hypothetical protein